MSEAKIETTPHTVDQVSNWAQDYLLNNGLHQLDPDRRPNVVRAFVDRFITNLVRERDHGDKIPVSNFKFIPKGTNGHFLIEKMFRQFNPQERNPSQIVLVLEQVH